MRIVPVPFVPFVLFVLLAALPFPAPAADLDRLAAGIETAAIRSDVPALRAAIAEVDALADGGGGARAHTLAAFARFQILLATMGNAPDMQAIAGDLMRHLEAARTADPESIDAHLLLAMARAAGLPPDRAVEASRADLAAARAIDPEDPRIEVADGLTRLFAGGAREPLERAVAAFRERGDAGGWWHATALGLLADVCLGSFGGTPDLACARDAADRALAIEAEYEYVHGIVAPWLVRRAPVAPPAIGDEAWVPIARDGAGDGQSDELSDAAALGWHHDAASDTHWFRFDYHRFVPGRGDFGVNLFLDVDGDPANGHGWVGGNRGFRFDRAVSVYVRPDGGGFVGVAAVATADGFYSRRLADLPGDVRFALLPSAPAIVVGIDGASLGDPATVRVLGAVGGANRFNDDLPDTGAARLAPAKPAASLEGLGRPLDPADTSPDGAAATLLAAVRSADRLIVGEMHGIAEVPELVGWLLDAGGYERLALEIGPSVAEELRGLVRDGGLLAALAGHADPVTVPFVTLREEAELLRTRPHLELCGLDQEFLLGVEWPLRRLREQQREHAGKIDGWIARQREGLRLLEARGDPSGLFLLHPEAAQLEEVPGADGLIASREIYRAMLAGRGDEANRSRERLLASNYDRCTRASDGSRTLVKIGALHAFRDGSPLGVPTLGEHLAGADSFHLLVLGGAETRVAALDLPTPRFRERPIRHPGWARRYLDHALDGAWTYFDLRGRDDADGFDAVVVLSGSTPSSGLVAAER